MIEKLHIIVVLKKHIMGKILIFLFIFSINLNLTGQTKPFSDSKTDGNLVFLSGKIPDSSLIKNGKIENQVENIMENIRKELVVYNLGFNDILKTTIFTTDISNYDKINRIYSSYFKDTSVPTRELIGVKELPYNSPIEISVIAKINKYDTSGALQNINTVRHLSFEKVEKAQINKNISRQFIYGKEGQFTIFELKKGAFIPMHSHHNEQITYITKGLVKVITKEDGREKTYWVKSGEALVIPSNIPHQYEALEDTIDFDIHVPVRADWFREIPAYLQESK